MLRKRVGLGLGYSATLEFSSRFHSCCFKKIDSSFKKNFSDNSQYFAGKNPVSKPCILRKKDLWVKRSMITPDSGHLCILVNSNAWTKSGIAPYWKIQNWKSSYLGSHKYPQHRTHNRVTLGQDLKSLSRVMDYLDIPPLPIGPHLFGGWKQGWKGWFLSDFWLHNHGHLMSSRVIVILGV